MTWRGCKSFAIWAATCKQSFCKSLFFSLSPNESVRWRLTFLLVTYLYHLIFRNEFCHENIKAFICAQMSYIFFPFSHIFPNLGLRKETGKTLNSSKMFCQYKRSIVMIWVIIRRKKDVTCSLTDLRHLPG